MKYFDVKVDPKGVKALGDWAKANLSDELLDQLAEKLDGVVVFGGVLGRLIEMNDGKVFRMLLKEGTDLLLGE